MMVRSRKLRLPWLGLTDVADTAARQRAAGFGWLTEVSCTGGDGTLREDPRAEIGFFEV
jgi:hypothetical protein